MTINSAFIQKWLKLVGGRYRSMLALSELQLYTCPKVIYRFSIPEDQQERLLMTIKMLRQQYGVLFMALERLPDQMSDPLIAHIYEGPPAAGNLGQAKKEFIGALKEMRKAGNIKATVTSESYLLHLTDQGATRLGSVPVRHKVERIAGLCEEASRYRTESAWGCRGSNKQMTSRSIDGHDEQRGDIFNLPNYLRGEPADKYHEA